MDTIIANKTHNSYAYLICDTIAYAAKVRGSGIAKRKSE